MSASRIRFGLFTALLNGLLPTGVLLLALTFSVLSAVIEILFFRSIIVWPVLVIATLETMKVVSVLLRVRAHGARSDRWKQAILGVVAAALFALSLMATVGVIAGNLVAPNEAALRKAALEKLAAEEQAERTLLQAEYDEKAAPWSARMQRELNTLRGPRFDEAQRQRDLIEAERSHRLEALQTDYEQRRSALATRSFVQTPEAQNPRVRAFLQLMHRLGLTRVDYLLLVVVIALLVSVVIEAAIYALWRWLADTYRPAIVFRLEALSRIDAAETEAEVEGLHNETLRRRAQRMGEQLRQGLSLNSL